MSEQAYGQGLDVVSKETGYSLLVVQSYLQQWMNAEGITTAFGNFDSQDIRQLFPEERNNAPFDNEFFSGVLNLKQIQGSHRAYKIGGCIVKVRDYHLASQDENMPSLAEIEARDAEDLRKNGTRTFGFITTTWEEPVAAVSLPGFGCAFFKDLQGSKDWPSDVKNAVLEIERNMPDNVFGRKYDVKERAIVAFFAYQAVQYMFTVALADLGYKKNGWKVFDVQKMFKWGKDGRLIVTGIDSKYLWKNPFERYEQTIQKVKEELFMNESSLKLFGLFKHVFGYEPTWKEIELFNNLCEQLETDIPQ